MRRGEETWGRAERRGQETRAEREVSAAERQAQRPVGRESSGSPKTYVPAGSVSAALPGVVVCLSIWPTNAAGTGSFASSVTCNALPSPLASAVTIRPSWQALHQTRDT